MDALTELLRGVRLAGNLFGRMELRAPWGVDFPRTEVAVFHLVVRGSGWLQTDRRGAGAAIAAGDLVLMPHGSPHALLERPGLPVVPLARLVSAMDPRGPPLLRGGGRGAETVLVCGFFSYDRREMPRLLEALPKVIHVRSDRAPLSPWLTSAVQALAAEASAEYPGRGAMLDHLTGLLFVEALRTFLQGTGDGEGGWLRALTHPQVGRALNALHADAARAWTVASLAREARMSRSAFAQTFLRLAGEPPMRYLARWRMRRAAFYLRTESLTVLEAMQRVGYESEATFSRAFKRWMGVPPAAYRRQSAGPAMTADPIAQLQVA